MLYIDTKYANMLSPYVRNYKYLGKNLWRFSCPICGDSKSNTRKARGYFFVKDQSLIFKCQNCGAGRTMRSFLKDINNELYKEYNLENFLESKSSNKPIFTDEVKIETVVVENKTVNLPCVYDLPEDNKVKRLLLERKLSDNMLKNFYYASNFKQWMHDISEDYYPEEESRKHDYGRIVIPYLDEDNKLFGFSCRAVGNETPKYINGKLDKSKDLVYGLNKVDKNKRVYIFEGPIDSMFINNGIAVSGSSFLNSTTISLQDKVFCYDNERRKKETLNKMEQIIEGGHNIYIPPDNIVEKDINDMIKSGYSIKDIHNIIESNVFSGLYAKLRFVEWRRK